MRKTSKFLLIFIVATCLFGCGAGSNMESFLRQDVDLSYVERVAVMPMQNNSKDTFASERVRDMVITQILSRGIFDVVDKGLVDSALRDEAVNLAKAPMDNTVMKRLGQRLNAQAFMMGTIDNAEQVQRGAVSFPDLSITLRLVDTNTGSIFWQASGHRSGDSLGKRLFGLGSDDSFRVSMKLLRRLLATIPDNSVVKGKDEGSKIDAVSVKPISGNDGGEVLPIDDSPAAADSVDKVLTDEGADGGTNNVSDEQIPDTIEGNDSGGDEVIGQPDDENADLSSPGDIGTNNTKDGSGQEDVIMPDFSGEHNDSSDSSDSADSVIGGSDNSDGIDLNDENVQPDMIPPE